MKKCNVCLIEKPLTEFRKKKYNSGNIGYRYNCKQCQTIERRNYVRKNSKNVKEVYKRYYERNRLKIKEAQKINYFKNKNNIIKHINSYNKTKDDGLYYKYWSMVRRCKYPSQSGYKWYGAKGICVEWKTYKDFKGDMYEGYLNHIKKHSHKQTTIDRIDSDKNYCKENCRWATYKEQGESLSKAFLKKKVNKYIANTKL